MFNSNANLTAINASFTAGAISQYNQRAKKVLQTVATAENGLDGKSWEANALNLMSFVISQDMSEKMGSNLLVNDSVAIRYNTIRGAIKEFIGQNLDEGWSMDIANQIALKTARKDGSVWMSDSLKEAIAGLAEAIKASVEAGYIVDVAGQNALNTIECKKIKGEVADGETAVFAVDETKRKCFGTTAMGATIESSDWIRGERTLHVDEKGNITVKHFELSRVDVIPTDEAVEALTKGQKYFDKSQFTVTSVTANGRPVELVGFGKNYELKCDGENFFVEEVSSMKMKVAEAMIANANSLMPANWTLDLETEDMNIQLDNEEYVASALG